MKNILFAAFLFLLNAASFAQNAPTITTPPSSQTNLAGASVTLNVAVSGTGPFAYQWQFNGTNLPSIITTVAGGGTNYPGGGGAATNVSLRASMFYIYGAMNGLAVDASGNLFITSWPMTTNDSGHVWKVDLNGDITKVAGNASRGYSGDGGAATNASLSPPAGLAVDASGNLFIADRGNFRIRKVDANGLITTVAGNGYVNPNTGAGGYSGDGGAATSARLNNPDSVAVDASGNLFIADSGNNRVRKVGVNGIITTVAGNGTSGYSGDGGAATSASLNNPDGVAVDASGNLFIADSGNNRIRKVGVNGIITTVTGKGSSGYSGDGGAAINAVLNFPVAVAVDVFGNLLIADQSNSRIRKVDAKGLITTVAGGGVGGDGGPAIGAFLSSPSGVAVDASGNLFIADSGNNRIRKVVLAGLPALTLDNVSASTAGDYQVIITSPYGSVTSAVATLTVRVPPSVATQPTNLAVKIGGSAAFSVAPTGTQPFSYAWYFNGTNLLQVGTNSTLSLANVNLAVAGGYAVVVTNLYGSVTSVVATLSVGAAPTIANEPASQTAVFGSNVALNVAAAGTGPFSYQWQLNGTNLLNLITTVAGNGYYNLNTDSGIYSGDGGPATAAGLSLGGPLAFFVSGVAVDASGNLFIADNGNNVIRKVDLNGVITTVAGHGSLNPNTGAGGYSGDGGVATSASLSGPDGVAVDAAGNLFIADSGNNRVRKVGVNGIITTVAGNGSSGNSGDGGAATNASLNSLSGVSVDNLGNLFIADYGRIRKVDANGIITTVTGGEDNYRGALGEAVDAAGNLYGASPGGNVIWKVDVNGLVTTVAGNGAVSNLFNYPVGTYSGDGGAATNAGLNIPYGVAVDASGNLFIADTGNERIRKVALGGLLPRLALNHVSPATAGDYQVVITSPFGSVTSAVATVTVWLPPSIVAQPANFGAAVGGAAAFSVSAAGTPPISYAWYFNRTNLLAVGTNSILSLANASLAAGGGYEVVITNLFGSVTSRVATLSVGHPPTIANEPTNQSALFGSNLTLNVTAAGASPLTYQWQLNGTNFPNDINIDLITTVAGGGTNNPGAGYFFGDGGAATNAGLNHPGGVAVDASGNLFIADSYNGRIRKVDPNGIIFTVAGNGAVANVYGYGVGTYSGDGGGATNAGLNQPTGLALDASGNLFIADSRNNRIRKVDATGVITTVAGNGSVITNQNGQPQGYYSGDGGAATNASLYNPSGVAADASGNLYIVDSGNNRIRKVDATGLMTTVAGNGNVIPDQYGNYGPEDGYYSGDGGAATNASLNGPAGVAVDASGNLFIADSGNNRIRKVDANGVITTVAGNSTVTNIQYYGSAGSYSGDGGAATNAGLSNPSSVAVDASGNLFIADDLNFRIRKVDVNGIITTVAGNGPYGYGSSPNTLGDGGSYPYGTYSGDSGAATNASLNYSYGVTVDASGNLFIADSGNNRIREIAPGGLLPQLSLNQASASTAGNFQVIIIGPYGSVTSTVASVTVLLPPSSQIPGKVMSVPLIAGNNVILGFSLSQTTSASLLTLLQAPSLTGPWTTNAAAVLTRNAQTGGYQFSVPVTGSVEFYQLRSP